MHTISKRQCRLLQEKCDKSNAEKLRQRLAARNESLLTVYSEDKTSEMILTAVVVGRTYGMQAFSSLDLLFRLMIEVHPRFYDHPEVQEILTDESTIPDARLAVMLALDDFAGWKARF